LVIALMDVMSATALTSLPRAPADAPRLPLLRRVEPMGEHRQVCRAGSRFAIEIPARRHMEGVPAHVSAPAPLNLSAPSPTTLGTDGDFVPRPGLMRRGLGYSAPLWAQGNSGSSS
jgi:hypothetical protein